MYVCCMVQRAQCMCVLCSTTVRKLHPSGAYYVARCGDCCRGTFVKGVIEVTFGMCPRAACSDSDSGTLSIPDAAHAHTHLTKPMQDSRIPSIASCHIHTYGTAKTRASSADSTQCTHPGSATLPTLWCFRSNQTQGIITITCSSIASIRSNGQQQPKIMLLKAATAAMAHSNSWQPASDHADKPCHTGHILIT
jgi:hypothetical protein